MPDEFLWSEWGQPDKLCDVGIQKKNTMCGALRRRLPNPGRDDDPPVYWPSCLNNKFNEAADRQELDKPLEDCMNDCVTTPDCQFWTFNKTEEKCYYSKIFKVSEDISGPDYVGGSKDCKGKLYFPHCGVMNMNYSSIADVITPNENSTSDTSTNTTITSIKDCIQSCMDNEDCFNYNIETNADFTTLINCELYGEVSGGDPVPTTDTDKYFVFGDPLTCSVALKDTPAVPEDAEELSYKETCTKDQYEEVVKENNTWSIEYCPSTKVFSITSKNTFNPHFSGPCEKNGECPSGSECIDLSTDIAPNYTCICRMGLVMEGGRCIGMYSTLITMYFAL